MSEERPPNGDVRMNPQRRPADEIETAYRAHADAMARLISIKRQQQLYAGRDGAELFDAEVAAAWEVEHTTWLEWRVSGGTQRQDADLDWRARRALLDSSYELSAADRRSIGELGARRRAESERLQIELEEGRRRIEALRTVERQDQGSG